MPALAMAELAIAVLVMAALAMVASQRSRMIRVRTKPQHEACVFGPAHIYKLLATLQHSLSNLILHTKAVAVAMLPKLEADPPALIPDLAELTFFRPGPQ